MRLQLTLIALAFRYSSKSVLSFPTNGIESQTHLSPSIHRRMEQPLQLARMREETNPETLTSLFSPAGVLSYRGSFDPLPSGLTFTNGESVPLEPPLRKYITESEERQIDVSDQQKSASDSNIDSKTSSTSYSPERLSKDLKMRFGEALKINNNEVYPLTAQSFDVLKALPSDLGWGAHQAQTETADVLKWYRTNKMASLAPEQQQVLDFNLEIATSDHRPWWTDENMLIWKTANMPWKTITRVGSILERRVKNSMSPEELDNVRNEILYVLDDFATHNDIEENIEDEKIQSRGAIAAALKQVTEANKESKSKTIYLNFDEKLHLIGLQRDEIKELAIILENQNRGLLHLNKRFRVLVHMQLLLNGIPYDIAEKYAKAYKTASAAHLSLLRSDMDMFSLLKDILPREKGGKIYHMATYEALKSFFSDIYGERWVKFVDTKISLMLPFIEKRIRSRIGWMPVLGQ